MPGIHSLAVMQISIPDDNHPCLDCTRLHVTPVAPTSGLQTRLVLPGHMVGQRLGCLLLRPAQKLGRDEIPTLCPGNTRSCSVSSVILSPWADTSVSTRDLPKMFCRDSKYSRLFPRSLLAYSGDSWNLLEKPLVSTAAEARISRSKTCSEPIFPLYFSIHLPPYLHLGTEMYNS